jgi:hypothetical protein
LAESPKHFATVLVRLFPLSSGSSEFRFDFDGSLWKALS